MDGNRFDQLTVTLTAVRPRRALLRLLTAIPLIGALVALLSQESEAGRRRRRKARHDPGGNRRRRQRRRKQKRAGKNKNRKRRRGCTPEPAAQTCAGKCGSVQNSCGQNLNCTALCAGCCAGTTCLAGTADAICGTGGGACQDCGGLGQLCSGGGVPGVCGCASDPVTCAGKCGPVQNNCDQPVDCTALCAGCCDGATCEPGNTTIACGNDGVPCVTCGSAAGVICYADIPASNGTCVRTCTIDGDCGGGSCTCFALPGGDRVCVDIHAGTCFNHENVANCPANCPSGSVCLAVGDYTPYGCGALATVCAPACAVT
jgi:hypothetical protein